MYNLCPKKNQKLSTYYIFLDDSIVNGGPRNFPSNWSTSDPRCSDSRSLASRWSQVSPHWHAWKLVLHHIFVQLGRWIIILGKCTVQRMSSPFLYVLDIFGNGTIPFQSPTLVWVRGLARTAASDMEDDPENTWILRGCYQRHVGGCWIYTQRSSQAECVSPQSVKEKKLTINESTCIYLHPNMTTS